MFSRFTPARTASLLALLAVLAAACWFFTRPDPRAAFLHEVGGMLDSANAGEHHELLKHLSPELEQLIQQEYMSPPAALRWVRQADLNQNRTYRLANLAVFHERDYAEVEIERSAPGREFNGQNIFPVPFLWRDGRWWVAAAFRGERDWKFPE